MTRNKHVLRRPKKRPYRAPALKTYGDLRTLTMVTKGSTRSDGAQPKSRSAGSP